MTDAELRDQAVAALERTTVGYRNKLWKTPPAGSQWAKGLALLAQIDAGPQPPIPAVILPLPPAPYNTIPASATPVNSSAALLKALAANTPSVVLDDGTYDNPVAFQDTGTSIYSRNLGKAVFTAAIAITNPTNPVTIQGPKMSVSDPAKGGAYGSCLSVWDSQSKGVTLLDLAVDGNKALPYGVWGGLAPNLAFQRATLTGFRPANGVYPVAARLENSGIAQTISYQQISDLDISDVTAQGQSNGTAEVGLWVGHQTVNGVQRIRVRLVSLASIETVNDCHDTTFEDITIDMSGANQAGQWTVGVYHEHFSNNLTFNRENMVGVHQGHTCEWDDGTPGNQAVNNLTVTDAVIDASGCNKPRACGIYGDAGTNGITATNVTFKNQDWAAIGAFQNKVPPVAKNCVYEMLAGAVPLSTDHI